MFLCYAIFFCPPPFPFNGWDGVPLYLLVIWNSIYILKKLKYTLFVLIYQWMIHRCIRPRWMCRVIFESHPTSVAVKLSWAGFSVQFFLTGGKGTSSYVHKDIDIKQAEAELCQAQLSLASQRRARLSLATSKEIESRLSRSGGWVRKVENKAKLSPA